MKLENGSKILFTGDSITDAGRTFNDYRNVDKNYGGGYVSMIHSLMQLDCRERGYRIVNTGVSGNTIRHLRDRWESDVIAHAPDWLSVMIGVNDTWRHFTRPEEAVGLDEYVSIYTELLERTRKSLKGLVLMTPFMAETDPPHQSDGPAGLGSLEKSAAMRALIGGYVDAVKVLAAKYDAVLVDIQGVIDDMLGRGYDPLELTRDKVHPIPLGCLAIARAWMKAVI